MVIHRDWRRTTKESTITGNRFEKRRTRRLPSLFDIRLSLFLSLFLLKQLSSTTMAADDSRRRVIDLSVITELSVTEDNLVGNCPTGQTEGALEEMDVASEETNADGFKTVLRRKRRATSPELRFLSDSAKKAKAEHMKTIDLVVDLYVKDSSENVAYPKNDARNMGPSIYDILCLIYFFLISLIGKLRYVLLLLLLLFSNF